jgi:hypothetical protein
MSEHEHEGGKPPAPTEEGAGEKGLGTETGANQPGDDVIEEMPERRGEVRYPDDENPEGPPRTPQEGQVVEDTDDVSEASRGADSD